MPEFKWHIIDEKVPFEIGETGVRVLPFAGEDPIDLRESIRLIASV